MSRKHRWIKALIIGLGIVILLTAAIWYALAHLTEIVVGILDSKYPEVEFRVDSVKLLSLKELEVNRLSACDRSIDTDNSCITFDKALLSIKWKYPGRLKIKQVRITKPQVKLNITNGKIPVIDRMIGRMEADSESSIEQVQLEDGQIDLSIKNIRLKTAIAGRMVTLPQFKQSQWQIDLTELTLWHKGRPTEGLDGGLHLKLITSSDSGCKIRPSTLTMGEVALRFDGDFAWTQNRVNAHIDFQTEPFPIQKVIDLFNPDLPMGFTGKVHLDGRVDIDISDSRTMIVDGRATVDEGSLTYTIGSKLLKAEQIKLQANYLLQPLIEADHGSVLEVAAGLTVEKVHYDKYDITDLRSDGYLRQGRLKLSNIEGQIYGGKIVGSGDIGLTPQQNGYIFFNVDIEDFDTERLIEALKPEDVYISGKANGLLNFEGRFEELGRLHIRLESKPEGGIIRIADTEKFLRDLPGGAETAEALKSQLGHDQWDSFLDSMKNYRYQTGALDLRIDPERKKLKIGLSFSSEDPVIGDRNLEMVIHNIDQKLVPKFRYQTEGSKE